MEDNGWMKWRRVRVEEGEQVEERDTHGDVDNRGLEHTETGAARLHLWV